MALSGGGLYTYTWDSPMLQDSVLLLVSPVTVRVEPQISLI